MITAKLLREWGACWSDEQIAALGVTEMSPRQLATDERIPLGDRLWVLCRSIWYLDESAARLFAIESAAGAVHLAGDEDDQAQYLGLLNWLCEIEDLPAGQRADAWADAWAAAWDAARTAAWADAWAAAWAAARTAAWAAAWDAAWAAARADAWDAAWNAAWADARADAWDAAWNAAWADALSFSLDRALDWLGDYADGWEEDDIVEIQEAT